jgi:hypothetical protein
LPQMIAGLLQVCYMVGNPTDALPQSHLPHNP